MQGRFREHINTFFPKLGNQRLLLACSGGMDSMVLAHLLLQSGFDFALAHCNYKLRGDESDGDEVFVRQWAHARNKAVFTKTINLSREQGSIQLKARELRYRWFHQLLEEENFGCLLTAHHANDSVETFFINLSRATGLDGLSGIPAQQPKLARPLLPFTRAEILTYAHDQLLTWREDSSNSDTKYLRNQIRHQLLPILDELHPNFLANFMQTQRYLDLSGQLLGHYRQQLQQEIFREVGDGIEVPLSKLRQLEPLEGYLHLLFQEFGFTQWEDIKSLISAQSGKEIRSATHRLIKDRDKWILVPHSKEEVSVFLLNEGEDSTHPVHLRVEEVAEMGEGSPNVLYVDKETLNYPLKLRKWQNADYFYPLGMKGRKKLSKFFKDKKMSTIEKENQWLLCSKDAIVWVIGKRADNRFKVTKKTNQLLKFTLVL